MSKKIIVQFGRIVSSPSLTATTTTEKTTSPADVTDPKNASVVVEKSVEPHACYLDDVSEKTMSDVENDESEKGDDEEEDNEKGEEEEKQDEEEEEGEENDGENDSEEKVEENESHEEVQKMNQRKK
ncbi:unnamed protein product [Cochlearia groenlandica]